MYLLWCCIIRWFFLILDNLWMQIRLLGIELKHACLVLLLSFHLENSFCVTHAVDLSFKLQYPCFLSKWSCLTHCWLVLLGTFNIGRKDRLWKNYHRLRLKFGKEEFSFLPRTFCLPADTKLLRRVWEKRGCRAKWIVKPPALARGTGITVINKWSQVRQISWVQIPVTAKWLFWALFFFFLFLSTPYALSLTMPVGTQICV